MIYYEKEGQISIQSVIGIPYLIYIAFCPKWQILYWLLYY